MRKLLYVLLLFFIALPLAHAAEAPSVAADPVLEERVVALAAELRCLVCQNQSLEDSHAELAMDLKHQIREKLRQGESEREILDYMVERYGDFVLYRPPVKSTTWLLWFGPVLLLVLGFVVLFMKLRQRRSAIAKKPVLSAAEHARAASLLSETAERDRS